MTAQTGFSFFDTLTSGLPLHQQIRERVRQAIIAGNLVPGSRLPSWAQLASELDVARGTVRAAYQWLEGEGLLVSRGAAGTFVNPSIAISSGEPQSEPINELLTTPKAFHFYEWGTPPIPFQLGVPAIDAFPRSLWSRMIANASRRLSSSMMTYPDPCGWEPLREALAGYLMLSRGVRCDPSQIFITNGHAGAVSVIVHALGVKGQRCWVEDPGFPRSREALRCAGVTPVPVPVDREGMSIDEGLRQAPEAILALVTPSHQAPLGVALSMSRRATLLSWATERNSWILEDDYFGEMGLKREISGALASTAGHRTIYMGSFSKVIMPALRLGYIVVPRSVREQIHRVVSYLAPAPSTATQIAVTEFIERGHFSRHVGAMRRLYEKRRHFLSNALESGIPEDVTIGAANSMYLLAYFNRIESDQHLASIARSFGLGPAPLSNWSVNSRLSPALLLSFTNLNSRAMAETQVERLSAILRLCQR